MAFFCSCWTYKPFFHPFSTFADFWNILLIYLFVTESFLKYSSDSNLIAILIKMYEKSFVDFALVYVQMWRVS